MLKSTTLHLPEPLIAKAKDYAIEHQTTLTALVIEQLETITAFKNDDPLVMFSRGLLTKEQAIKACGVRHYAALLVALGDADLPLPSLPKEEIEKQALLFTQIYEESNN